MVATVAVVCKPARSVCAGKQEKCSNKEPDAAETGGSLVNQLHPVLRW